MATKKIPISVGLVDLPDHERVILKMIFAVSQRSAMSNFAYTITDVKAADIVLQDAGSHTPIADRVVFNVTSASPDQPLDAVMLRPLIATRVLAVLDDYFAQQHRAVYEADDGASEAPGATTTPEVSDIAIIHEEPIAPSQAPAAAPGNVVARDIAMVDTALLNDEIVVSTTHVAEKSNGARKRGLVVDDSQAVRKQLEIELVHFDVDVDFAASARQAIAMIDAHAYDVVFLDVVLPDMDGYQICKRIKANAKRTKVIMLTGKATTEDKLKGTLAGCDAYLVKPVGRLTFQSTVKSYLPLSVGAQALKL